MGDDITIGVTEIVNNIEVTAQPNDQIVDISVIDNADDVTLNITPTVIEINVNKGSSYAKWGGIIGTLSDQEDLQDALDLKANDNAVVHLTGNENISGTKTFGNTIYANGGTGEGEYAIEIDKSFEGEAIRVKNSSSTTFTLGLNGAVTALRYVKSGGTSSQFLKADGSVDSTSYQTSLGYTPANDSAVVHIEGVETVNGIKTFSNSTKFDYGINLKQDTTTAYFPNYTTIDGYNNGYIVNNGDARAAIFYLANNVSRVYNFPDANGTFALTSDLSPYALDNSVVKLTGDQTVAGIKTFTSDVKSTAFRLTGGTSGTGLYYGHTNKVVLANYTVGGGIDFETNGGNINMILNSNGNLGIGVDPSDWDSLWKVLQISKGSYYASDYSNIMAHNLYVAGEDTKYISSNLASQYEQNSGSHYWYTAPSGTAGANMTLSPRMILTNDGKLGIGTSSPTRRLEVASDGSNWISGTFSGTGSTDKVVIGNLAGATIGSHNAALNAWSDFTIAGTDIKFSPYGSEAMRVAASGNVGIGTTDVDARFKAELLNVASLRVAYNGTSVNYYDANENIFRSGAGTERMRITYGGNVGIGTTNPSGAAGTALAINGGAGQTRIALKNNFTGDNPADGFQILLNAASADVMFENRENGFVAFATNDIERIRITSGGNLCIGKTVPNSKLDVAGSIIGEGMLVDNTSNNQQLSFRKSGAMRYAIGTEVGTGSTNDWSIYNYVAGATSFIVYGNNNYQFYGSNVSDIRAKQDIQDLDFNATEKIAELRPKSYYMKNDPNQIRYGLIAQDVHEILPDLVCGDLEGEGFVGLDYNGIIPVLVKSIQELKAEIEILKNK